MGYSEWVENLVVELRSANSENAALRADLAAAVEVLRKYTKTGIARCENPIRERVLPTKFLEEWKLHDCGKCLYCNAVALLARMEVKP